MISKSDKIGDLKLIMETFYPLQEKCFGNHGLSLKNPDHASVEGQLHVNTDISKYWVYDRWTKKYLYNSEIIGERLNP